MTTCARGREPDMTKVAPPSAGTKTPANCDLMEITGPGGRSGRGARLRGPHSSPQNSGPFLIQTMVSANAMSSCSIC